MSRWHLIDNSLEGRQRVFFPHYTSGQVPTDPEDNARFRERLRLTSSPSERAVIERMCAEDFLFYLCSFVYIFQADVEGDDEPGPVPFLPYEFQLEMFTAMWRAMHEGKREKLRMKKPRRVGATWSVLAMFDHCWRFMANRHLLVGSRREEEVDGSASTVSGNTVAGEWSRLLPKIDYMHLHLPAWMLPDGYVPRTDPFRMRMKVVNPENGSIVWGTSASGGAGRSERGYAAFWDEAAHTQNLYEIIGSLSKFSACIFWVSSIGNLDHPFSSVLRDPPITQLNPEWWMHPDYGKGLEVGLEDGKRVSPWLVRACAELGNDPVLCNREIFADEGLQIGGYYPEGVFKILVGSKSTPGTLREPLHTGELDIETHVQSGPWVTRFCPQHNGRWKFWLAFDSSGRPPRGTRYVIGVDIAAATQKSQGSSNSVIAVCDYGTREIVAEFAAHGGTRGDGVIPYDLARIAAAVGKWFEGEDFGPAVINFERNGPGEEFGAQLVQKLRYPNVWVEKPGSGVYGWFKSQSGEIGVKAFGIHREMLTEGDLIERSAACADEMRHYQYTGVSTTPVHASSIHTEDPSGAKANHGDRVIARIVICQVLNRWSDDPPESPDEPLRGSRAWLEARREQDARSLQRV
jgi:hypothetical protein